MFGILRKKHPLVYTHWHVLLPQFRSSTSRFYEIVEAELREIKVPAMHTTIVIFNQGGLGSHRRAYLRMQRERQVFDVCSAPFGTSWFFSCRIAELPFVLRLWELFLLLWIGTGLFFLFPPVFGFWVGSSVFAASILGALVLLNTLAVTSTRDVDSILLRVPIIGALYELFLRRNNTYYREDSRIMYSQTVDAVVRAAVRHLAAEQGIEEIQFIDNKAPISPRPYHEKISELVSDIAAQVGDR